MYERYHYRMELDNGAMYLILHITLSEQFLYLNIPMHEFVPSTQSCLCVILTTGQS